MVKRIVKRIGGWSVRAYAGGVDLESGDRENPDQSRQDAQMNYTQETQVYPAGEGDASEATIETELFGTPRRIEGQSEQRILTLGLLAGAYEGGRKNLKAMLTHALASGADKTLCGRIDADKLVDEYGMSPEALNGPPSCPICLKRDPRFNVRSAAFNIVSISGAGVTTFSALEIGDTFMRLSGARKDVLTKASPTQFTTSDGRQYTVDNALAQVMRVGPAQLSHSAERGSDIQGLTSDPPLDTPLTEKPAEAYHSDNQYEDQDIHLGSADVSADAGENAAGASLDNSDWEYVPDMTHLPQSRQDDVGRMNLEQDYKSPFVRVYFKRRRKAQFPGT